MTGDGVVVVDKPAGMTSHDVVDRVRKLYKTKKVGHSGTLDPDATGVLVLGVNKATRFLSYTQSAPKRYRTTAVFGVTTSTQDASGAVLEERPVDLTQSQLEIAMKEFVGDIEQIPPMVSAVRVGGERLYKKARRGEEIEREPRPVTIYELELVEFSGAEATLEVRCSGGTYVRTLVHDLGERLGCGAHLRDLRRIEAGGFTEDDAVPLDELSPGNLLPLSEVVRELRRLDVDAEAASAVRNGRPLPGVPGDAREGDRLAVVSEGRLLGVYRREGAALVADRVVGA